VKGIVTKSTGSWYTVRLENGSTIECRLKGVFRTKGIKSTNPVAVGDRVTIERDEEVKGSVITQIEDRENYVIRKSVNLSKRSHIIAANVDQAVLIATVEQPKTLQGFIDRFLVAAEAYDIPAVIVFNKIDLYSDESIDELEFYDLMYRDIGYQVLATSAVTGDGMDDLADVLRDKVSLLSGNSGVGKSTLINAIDPDLDLKTGKISKSHKLGQHTTTFAEMFPLSIGGDIIDTPGIRSFGMVDMEDAEISHYFPELFELSSGCKFNNCMHINEPGCAVLEALENGDISPTRYKSYINILKGLDDENPYRVDEFAE
jgi:ribosome biogenesis GTPase